ncbi:MAG: DUF484 family protein [Psychrobium sp.]
MNQIDDLAQLLDDGLVEEYLRENPDFLAKRPHLLNQLDVTQQKHGTVSLVQRQQRIMREKIVTLEDEITSLMAIASQNQRLYQKFAGLFFELLNCVDLHAINNTLNQHFINELELSHVSFKLFKNQSPESLYINRSELDNLLVQRLGRGYHYFGRINQQEQQLLFNHPEPGSVALIALGSDGELGLLAISSDDPNHFHPEMDSLLLMQLTRLIASIVKRLLAE